MIVCDVEAHVVMFPACDVDNLKGLSFIHSAACKCLSFCPCHTAKMWQMSSNTLSHEYSLFWVGLVFWLKPLFVFDRLWSNPGPPRPLQHVSAHNIHLSHPDMKQDHQRNNLTGHNLKMIQILSIPLFIAPPTFFPWESRFTQWSHYWLFTSLFCIWRVDKPVVVTHRPTHNAHNVATADLWCRCTRVWCCVGWPGFLSPAPHDLPLACDL